MSSAVFSMLAACGSQPTGTDQEAVHRPSNGAGVSTTVCGSVAEGSTLKLSCPSGTTISAVSFASYGTPTGSCGSYAASACNAATSLSVVDSACLGRTSCTVTANNATFGDPCYGTDKNLDAQVTCSSAGGSSSSSSSSSGGSSSSSSSSSS